MRLIPVAKNYVHYMPMTFVIFIGLWQNLRYRGLLPEELAQSMYITKDVGYLIETYLIAHLIDYS
jgi:hypothetical protein